MIHRSLNKDKKKEKISHRSLKFVCRSIGLVRRRNDSISNQWSLNTSISLLAFAQSKRRENMKREICFSSIWANHFIVINEKEQNRREAKFSLKDFCRYSFCFNDQKELIFLQLERRWKSNWADLQQNFFIKFSTFDTNYQIEKLSTEKSTWIRRNAQKTWSNYSEFLVVKMKRICE